MRIRVNNYEYDSILLSFLNTCVHVELWRVELNNIISVVKYKYNDNTEIIMNAYQSIRNYKYNSILLIILKTHC